MTVCLACFDGVAAMQTEYVDYYQLDYLETTNTLYVDTGIAMDMNTAIEAVLACTPAESTAKNISGSVYGGSGGWTAIGDYGEGALCSYFAKGSRANTGVMIPYDTDFHYYYCGNGLQVIDSITNTTTVTSQFAPQTSSAQNLRVFAANLDDMPKETQKPRQRIKYFNVYQNGVKVRELIPVQRVRDGVLCFYDRVSKGYFEKNGTGDFVFGVKGKRLPGGYVQLDYIYSRPQKAGSAYTDSNDYFVDTGYTPTSINFGFYFDFLYDGVVGTDAPRIMGSSKKDSNSKWKGLLLGAYSSQAWTKYGQFCAAGSGVADDIKNPCIWGQCRRVLEFKNRVFVAADGTATDMTQYSDATGYNGSIWLGNVHADDYASKTGSAPIRIYRFKIYDGNATIHDFVPVVSEELGKVGLLDVVGDKGFREGTGFFAGPLVPDCDFAHSTRLEYIESDGGQSIDTGVVAMRSTAMEATMSVVAQTGANNAIGAVYGQNAKIGPSVASWIAIGDYGEGYLTSYFATDSRTNAGVTIPYDSDFHYYYCGNGRQAIDTTVNTTTAVKEMPKTLNVHAFHAARNFTQSPTPTPKVRIQKMKIQSNGVLVRDLVPVLSGGVVCMYDKVGKKFYYNDGTGALIAGPRMNRGLTLFFR